MTPFEKYLESIGFQADACRMNIEPDFFLMSERLFESHARAEAELNIVRGDLRSLRHDLANARQVILSFQEIRRTKP